MLRRRFIQIVAASAACAPRYAQAEVQRWNGHAMGAEVSLELHGAQPGDIHAARDTIRAMEAAFSIYDPMSELSRINEAGGGTLSAEMSALLQVCDLVHSETNGLFDPTVQPVFAALARGHPPPWHLVGWEQVALSGNGVVLNGGQALTFNGIAQGFATDRVRDLLMARGLRHGLIAIGEHAALGGPFRLALEDPEHGRVGMRTLTDGALATSSPGALRLGSRHHILHPAGGLPLWSSVSVEAQDAVVADAVSTALCFAPPQKIAKVAARLRVRVTVVDQNGDVQRIG